MAEVNLVNQDVIGFNAEIDSVTIVKILETIPGGRALDVTGYTPDVIKAGHVVIKETATGNYKPFPVAAGGAAYDTLPANHTIEGIVISSVPTDMAAVGILVRGTVNEATSPYPVTAAIKTALPLIRFIQD
jgi:hypothetical protein